MNYLVCFQHVVINVHADVEKCNMAEYSIQLGAATVPIEEVIEIVAWDEGFRKTIFFRGA